jgi:hypothetical protein
MNDTTTDPHSGPPDARTAPTGEDEEAEWAAEAEMVHQRRISMPLVFIGLRCIARYVALPFVLPLLATAVVGAWRDTVSGAVLAVLLVLDVAGVMSIAGAIRHLFRDRHPHRWKYVLAALALTAVIVAFFINDARIVVFAH